MLEILRLLAIPLAVIATCVLCIAWWRIRNNPNYISPQYGARAVPIRHEDGLEVRGT